MGIGEKYYYKRLRGKLSSWQMATNNPFDLSSRFWCYFPSLESLLVLWLVLTRRKRQKSSCASSCAWLFFTRHSTFHYLSLGIQPQSERAMGKITVTKEKRPKAVYTGIPVTTKEVPWVWMKPFWTCYPSHIPQKVAKEVLCIFSQHPRGKERKLSQLTEKSYRKQEIVNHCHFMSLDFGFICYMGIQNWNMVFLRIYILFKNKIFLIEI